MGGKEREGAGIQRGRMAKNLLSIYPFPLSVMGVLVEGEEEKQEKMQ